MVRSRLSMMTAAAFAGAAGAAALGAVAALFCVQKKPGAAVIEVWELKGKYYQVLGHAWDHEVSPLRSSYR